MLSGGFPTGSIHIPVAVLIVDRLEVRVHGVVFKTIVRVFIGALVIVLCVHVNARLRKKLFQHVRARDHLRRVAGFDGAAYIFDGVCDCRLPLLVCRLDAGSAVEKNKVIEIRGLKIDTTARRVWINGEEKTFTTKEFDLLTFLASHPNHVYTKEELFREIWDMESIGDIATVTVHINKIREKVEMDTSNPQYIETIWGVGYRFKV